MGKYGIINGRMCPVHFGHMSLIESSIEEHGIDRTLVIVGSIAQKPSVRVLFDFKTRANWLRRLYGPELMIVGAPDFPHDNPQWAMNIHHLVRAWTRGDSDTAQVTVYGGQRDEVDDSILKPGNYDVKIIDRSAISVSGTAVRDMIIKGEDISPYVHPKILNEVLDIGRKQFKKLDVLA